MLNNKTEDAIILLFVGKIILSISQRNDDAVIAFTDGTELWLYDDKQSCREARWMHTDADLPYYFGATLLDVSIESAAIPVPEDSDVYDAQFLHIHTDKGIADFVTHVDHNGYYGGFWIRAQKTK